MRISIIVPVYNVGAYLNECIESVRQLQAQKELILVDDGSTDESGALCDQWAAREPWIKAIHQENGGLSAARNTGIHNASGDYLLFLDSDDLLDPKETDAMLQELQGGEVLCGFYQNYYSKENRLEQEEISSVEQAEGELSISAFLKAVPADGRSFFMIACRFLVQRAFLLEKELFFLPGIYHEDEEWTQRLLCNLERITVSHHYFYLYRQAREGAITSGVKPKHLWDTFRIMKNTEALIRLQAADAEKAEYLNYRLAQLYLNNLLHLNVLSREERKIAARELKPYKKIYSVYGRGFWHRPVALAVSFCGIRMTGFMLHLVNTLLSR